MKQESSSLGPICLVTAAVLLLAFAVFMIVSPHAPRLVPNPASADGSQTLLTLYEGPKTMQSSETAKITVNGNLLETDVPDPEDPNVLFIGPGEWTMDAIALEDNQMLYLSGGAVLHSIISVNGSENVRICGRGLIDGSDYAAWDQPGSYARVPIDLGGTYSVQTVAVRLNPSAIWEARKQEIAVLDSTDGTTFTEIAPASVLQFGPATGNRVRIDFDATNICAVKVIFTMNSASRTGGAQAAEIEVYG